MMMTVHLFMEEMARVDDLVKYGDDVAWYYIPKELYVNGPNYEIENCKACPYLQNVVSKEPNRKEKDVCEATTYWQTEPNEKGICEAMSYLQDYEMDKSFSQMIKNDLMTLCRSSVEYVIEMIGWWTGGLWRS